MKSISDNWVIRNLESAIATWNDKLAELWVLITQTPETFKGGQIWSVIVNINSALVGIGYGLLVLFFAIGIFSSAASFKELQRPEFALRHFIRFVLAKVAVGRGMELMTAIFYICGSVVSASMSSIGGSVNTTAALPAEIVSAIEDVSFLQSIPLWLVSFLGSLFITVLSFILILTVYGRFFKLYIYTAISPLPFASLAGENTAGMGKAFVKSYVGVCLEGAVIVLACLIYSAFLSSGSPVVDSSLPAVTMAWEYIGELIFTGSGDGRNTCVPVSAEVEAYRPLIRLYASQYGIPEYEDLIAAVMMQENGGRGTDPMQCSESGYNTRYPHSPNSITDPEYSIDVGIQALANALQMASVESPIDLEHISLALQGYNFGNGYISWAIANYGGYSELNAIEFSKMMASCYSWAGYGDKAYVSHVLRYYPIGRYMMAEGNQAIVAVAQSQIGNDGLMYCEWYGYPYRVEWCAIFVSWCAEQIGAIDVDAMPRFEHVVPGSQWFVERGQRQDRFYEPLPGDIIFFDWERDCIPDHVGIVENCIDGIIHVIEGNNANDMCGRAQYTVGYEKIYGYGIM